MKEHSVAWNFGGKMSNKGIISTDIIHYRVESPDSALEKTLYKDKVTLKDMTLNTKCVKDGYPTGQATTPFVP